MTEQTDRTTAIYDAIDAFQRTHRLPGLQHAQIRGLLAEHLARTLPVSSAGPAAATDRDAVLLEAADELGRMDYDTDSNDYGYDTYRDAWNGGVMDAAALLRRMAGETQQDEPTDEDVVEAHRLALSFAVGLGTGAPWDAIRDRAAELHGAETPARVAQQDEAAAQIRQVSNECCGAEPPANGTWVDCWCTLPPGHDGEHQCQPCTDRNGAPGWTDADEAQQDPTQDGEFVPPAALGLPAGTLEAAAIGANRLDAWARTPNGRNFLAHALVQLARTGWLRTEPGEGFEPVRDRDDIPEPQDPASVARPGQPETDTQPADTAQQPEAPDVVAAIVTALQERAGELSELAEEQMRPSLEERAQEWLEAADVARRAAKAAVGAPAPFTPPAHYRRDDGVDCCVHTIPVGPDSCRHCRELHDNEPADTAQQPKEA